MDRKETIFLLADCQWRMNWLKARTNQEKLKNISQLERVRDFLLVARKEPTERTKAVKLALDLLNQME